MEGFDGRGRSMCHRALRHKLVDHPAEGILHLDDVHIDHNSARINLIRVFETS